MTIRNRFVFLFIVIAYFLFSSFGFSITRTVATGNAQELVRAIEVSANAGDIIQLPPGTYFLSSQIRWPNTTNITLRSTAEGNSSNVIISAVAQDTCRFASVNYGVSLSIENITIQNFGGPNFSAHGGVMWLADNVNLRLHFRDAVISGNEVNSMSNNNGGVFYVNGGGTNTTISADRVIFSGNKAYYGGVSYYGTNAWNSCVLQNNSAGSYGGVSYYGNHVWFNNRVAGNHSNYGGVAYNGTHAWTGCMVTGNYATYGGAVHSGTHTWNQNRVYNNFASNKGGVAYNGIHLWMNSVIIGNSATSGGGVAYSGTHRWIGLVLNGNGSGTNGAIAYYGNHTWTNCSVSMNSMAVELLYDTVALPSSLTVNNSILAGKLFALGGNYTLKKLYSNMYQGDSPKNYAGLGYTRAFFSDFEFLDEVLHVSTGSLCTDTGLNTLWNANSGNVTTDIEGNPRVSLNINLGAYEATGAVMPYRRVQMLGSGNPYYFLEDALLEVVSGSVIEIITSNLQLGWYNSSAVDIAWPNMNNVTLRAGVVAGYSSKNCVIEPLDTNTRRLFSVNNGVNLTIQNLTIQKFGGAGYGNDGAVLSLANNASMQINLSNLVISGNSVSNVKSGGVIVVAGLGTATTISADHMVFSTNSAGSGGVVAGGFFVANAITITGNRATDGAVFYGTTAIVKNSQIVTNIATRYGGVAFGGQNTWINVVLNANSALVNGAVAYNGQNTWTNCSVSMNSLTAEIVYQNSGSATLIANNSIFAGKVLAGTNLEANLFQSCLFSNDDPRVYGATLKRFLTGDPQFSDEGLHLGSGSLALDNGLVSLWMANSGNVKEDADGNSRVSGSIDLGAYEMGSTMPWQRVLMNGVHYYFIEDALEDATAGAIIEIITSDYLMGDNTGQYVVQPQFIQWPAKNNITLRAGAGFSSANCVIEAAVVDQWRFISVNYGVSLSIENVMIRNFGGPNYAGDGAVFWLGNVPNLHLNLRNTVISGNQVNIYAQRGGVFFISDNGYLATVSVNNSYLLQNSAWYGGVACYGTYTWINNLIESNIAGANGGVTYEGVHSWVGDVVQSNAALDNGGVTFGGTHNWTTMVVTGNTAWGTGGVSSEGNHSWQSCIINNNVSMVLGGVALNGTHTWRNVLAQGNVAIYGGVVFSGTHTWLNSVINENTVSVYGGVAYNSTITAVNCVLANNNADYDGSVLYNSTATLTNCSLSGNNATTELLYYDMPNYLITANNSIIAGKIFNDGAYGAHVFYNCLFSGDSPEYYYGVQYFRVLLGDPGFTDGLLHIPWNSVALEGGSTARWMANANGLTTDLAGTARVNNVVDIGAYEVGSASTRPSVARIGATNYVYLEDAFVAAVPGNVIEVITTNLRIGYFDSTQARLTWPNMNNLTLKAGTGLGRDTCKIEPTGVNVRGFIDFPNAVSGSIQNLTISGFGGSGFNSNGAVMMLANNVLTHVNLNSMIISGNSVNSGAYYMGGVFYVTANGINTSISLNQVTFSNNSAFNGGVAAFGNISAQNVAFITNHADANGGVAYYGVHTWLQSIAIGNYANTNGGIAYNGLHRWTNCSVSMNSFTNEIFYDNATTSNITANNTILAGKLLAGGGYEGQWYGSSMFKMDSPLNYVGNSIGYSRIVSADPLFVNGLLLISGTSPAVDMGSTANWNLVSFNLTTDFSNNTRIRNAIDIGAYEVGSSRVINQILLNSTTYYPFLEDALAVATSGSLIEVVTSPLKIGFYDSAVIQITWPNVNNVRLRAGGGLNKTNCIIEAGDMNTRRFVYLNNAVSLSIENITIQKFGGTGFAGHGAVFYAGTVASHLNLINDIISGNSVSTANSYAGGVYYELSAGTTSLVSANQVLFSNNRANSGGVANGGIHTWMNTFVAGNSVSTNGGVAMGGTHTWINTVVNGNSAGSAGGVLYQGTHTWLNCSVSMNTTTNEIINGSSFTAYNSIFAGKLLAGGTYTSDKFYTCLFKTETPLSYSGAVFTRLLYADPGFLNSNLQIPTTSIAVDMGLTSNWMTNSVNIAIDINGSPRISNAIDLGAYEAGSSRTYNPFRLNSTTLFVFLEEALAIAPSGSLIEVMVASASMGLYDSTLTQINWSALNNIRLRAGAGLDKRSCFIQPYDSNMRRFINFGSAVSASIENLTIQNFGGTTYASSGGVFNLLDSTLMHLNLSNVIFYNNKVNVANQSGGVINVAGLNTSISANQVVFINNQAYNGGVSAYGTHTWTNCLITGNTATNYGGVSYYGTYAWVNNVLNKNNATANGGIVAFGNHTWTNCSVSMNNTINEIYYDTVAVPYTWTVQNTILAGKLMTTSGGNYALKYFYNNLYCGDPLNLTGYAGKTYSRTISGNPAFTDDFLHIPSGSIATDTGWLPYWVANSMNMTTDFEGNLRVTLNNYLSIGAYEPNTSVIMPQRQVSTNGTLYYFLEDAFSNVVSGSVVEVLTDNLVVGFYNVAASSITWPTLNNVTLRAGVSAGMTSANCVISPWDTNVRRFLYVNSAVNMSIENITIKKFGGTSFAGHGGAIYLDNNAGFTAPWVFCASDGGVCTFDAFKSVKYGTDTRWAIQNNVNWSIGCNSNEFGVDPATDYSKSCYYYSAVPVNSGATLILNLRNSRLIENIANYTSGYYGGAVYSNYDITQIKADNVLFANNKAYYGGAMMNGTYTLSNCVITGNSAWHSGAVVYGGTSTWFNNQVFGNYTAAYDGGVVYGGTHIWYNSVLSGNTAARYGGVAYAVTVATWNNCTINNNIGYGQGGVAGSGPYFINRSRLYNNNGGSYGGIANGGTFVLTNSIVSGNFATYGGLFHGATHTLKNSIVNGNYASYGGIASSGTGTYIGSVFNRNYAITSGAFSYYNHSYLYNCSVSMNNTTNEIFYDLAASPYTIVVNNSILAGKLLLTSGGAYSQKSFFSNIYQGDSPQNYGGIPVANYNQRSFYYTNPQFTDEVLHVATSSIAFQTGWLPYWSPNSGNVTTDIDGSPRVSLNYYISIGAYEPTNSILMPQRRVTADGLPYYFLEDALANTVSGSMVEVVTTNLVIGYYNQSATYITWPNTPNVTLRAGASSGMSSINCVISPYDTNVRRFIYVPYVVSLSIENLTIQNFGGTSYADHGGAIYLGNNTSNLVLNLRNDRFLGNKANWSAGYYGGVIYSNYDISRIYADNVIFANNQAYHGGVMMYGSYTLNNCTITGNSAYYYGGVIYGGISTWNNNLVYANSAPNYDGGVAYAGTHIWSDCTLSGNYAGRYGGVVYASSIVTWNNCTVNNNTGASQCGVGNATMFSVNNSRLYRNNGGSYGGVSNGGTFVLSNSIISGNYATYGGLFHGTTHTLKNSIVNGNYASYGGIASSGTGTYIGSVFNRNYAITSGGFSYYNHSYLTNCSVSMNNATSEMFYDLAASPYTISVNNSILAGKLMLSSGGNYGQKYFYTNIFKGDAMSNYSGPTVMQVILADPQFVDDVLHVATSSVALHTAWLPSWMASSGNVTTDIDGNPRVSSNYYISVGAYEPTGNNLLPKRRVELNGAPFYFLEDALFNAVSGSVIEVVTTNLVVGYYNPAQAYILWPNTTNVTLRAGIAAGMSSINCVISPYDTNVRRFIYVPYIVSLSIENLTIQNFGGTGYTNHGGAIYLDNNTANLVLNLRNDRFFANRANWGSGYYGGVIYSNYDASRIYADSVIFANNQAYHGGVMMYGSYTLTNCTITGNSAWHSGGVIYGGNSSWNNNVVFANSTAAYDGGVAYGGGTHVWSNCTLSGNYAARYGGVLYASTVVTWNNCTANNNTGASQCGVGNAGKFSISNSRLYRNNGGSYGGVADGGTFVLFNSIVSGNYATYGGMFHGATHTLRNCIVNGNYAGYGGVASYGNGTYSGSVFNRNYASSYGGFAFNNISNITNCSISMNNNVEMFYDVAATPYRIDVNNSILSGKLLINSGGAYSQKYWYGNIYWGDSPQNYGSIPVANYNQRSFYNVNPQFTDDVLHVTANSMAIDTGWLPYWMANSGNVTADIDGNPRVSLNYYISIGAYEPTSSILMPQRRITADGLPYYFLEDALSNAVSGSLIEVITTNLVIGYYNQGATYITWPNTNNVTLRAGVSSGMTSANCVISPYDTNVRRFIYVSNAVSLSIENLTIQNFGGTGFADNGGAIYLYNNSANLVLNLHDDRFLGNKANWSSGYYGGVIYSGYDLSRIYIDNVNFANNQSYLGGVMANGSYTVTNCTISGNSVWHSGGVIYGGISTWNNNVVYANSSAVYDSGVAHGGIHVWNNCTISGNTAARYAGVTYGSTATWNNCTINNNTGSSQGGVSYTGVYVINNSRLYRNYGGGYGGIGSNGTYTISNSIVSGNYAASYGGVFAYANHTFKNCIVNGNYAGYGGVAAGTTSGAGGASGTYINSVFNRNYASTNGGFAFDGNAYFLNCSISMNNGAMEMFYDLAAAPYTISINNSILVGKLMLSSGGNYGQKYFYSDLLKGDALSNYSGPSVLHIISGDPQFVDDVLRIAPSSVAIHMGWLPYWMVSSGNITVDIDGNPRVTRNFYISMGAYEPPGSILLPQRRVSSDGLLYYFLEDALLNVVSGSIVEVVTGNLVVGYYNPAQPYILWPNTNNVTLRAGEGFSSANCVISPYDTNIRRFIYVPNAVSLSIENLTIQNFGGSGFSGHGGAIYLDNNTANLVLNIRNSRFLANRANWSAGGYYGGVIFSGYDASRIFIDNVNFTNNQAYYGGVMSNGTYTLTNCTITGNSAWHSGGVIYGGNSSWNNNVVYANSTAAYDAGVVYGGGTHVWSNCTLSGNYAARYGGVVYAASVVSWNNCTANNNTGASQGGVGYAGMFGVNNSRLYRNNGGGYGGLANGGTFVLTNSMVSGNYATYGGLFHATTHTIRNCIVNGNYAGYGGVASSGTGIYSGSVFNRNYASSYGGFAFNNISNITNCSISMNNNVEMFYDVVATPYTISVNNTILSGKLLTNSGGAYSQKYWYGNIYWGDSPQNYGSIPVANYNQRSFYNVNPQFTDDVLHVTANSMAVDMGWLPYWMANSENVTADIDGNPRVSLNYYISIGAYEPTSSILMPQRRITADGLPYYFLEDALSNAVSGSLIEVITTNFVTGYYNQGATYMTWPNTNNVTLRAGTGLSSANCVISPYDTNGRRFIYVPNAVSLSIENLTIQNFGGTSYANHGGAIYLGIDNTNLVLNLRNDRFYNNTVAYGTYSGGAIYAVGTNPQINVNNVRFNGNYGYNGGAVYGGTNTWRDSQADSNYAYYYGGVVYGGTTSWNNVTAFSNQAPNGGGGCFRSWGEQLDKCNRLF